VSGYERVAGGPRGIVYTAKEWTAGELPSRYKPTQKAGFPDKNCMWHPLAVSDGQQGQRYKQTGTVRAVALRDDNDQGDA
jgi:hypothetical protein